MSQLNITRNTFLEKEELTRLQEMMMDNVTHKLFVANTSAYGVVQSDFISLVPLDFQIQAGTNAGTIKISKQSYAFDSAGNLISQAPIDNIAVTSGTAYWVKISYKSTATEVGTVSVDAVGNLSGTGTYFNQVLRGQSTDVPTKIKFVNVTDESQSGITNDSTYEVVQVTGDNAAIIIGATSTFTPQSGMKYVVIGATPVSESVSSEQFDGLYKYDGCKIEFIAESTLNTMPTVNYLPGLQFYLARVYNDSGTVTILDERFDWWTFNIRGLSGKMDKTSNLGDIIDYVAARANLGVYSKAEVDALVSGMNKFLYAGSYYIGDVVGTDHVQNYTISFPSIGTESYYVIGTMVYGSTVTAAEDTTIIHTVSFVRTSTSFILTVRETGSYTQHLTYEYLLIKK